MAEQNRHRQSSSPRSGSARLLMIVVAVCAVVLSACSDGHIDVRSLPGVGWPSYGGDANNANFTTATVPDDLALSWSRPTGGPITAPLTVSTRSNVAVTSRTENGCNTFVFDPTSGRKNFCKRMREGVEVSALLIDQYDQPYIGEQTTFLAFNAGGAIRWRAPVLGVPLSAKFAAPNIALVVTTQGQIQLFDTQTAALVAPELLLRPDADPADPLFGFGECVDNGPRCVVPAPPAVDAAHERFFLNVWPPGAIASQVRAFTYHQVDGKRTVAEAWHADVPGGVVGPATVSADGATVYAFSRLGQIVALDAATGKTRWTFDNGGYGFATMAVSPDGLIMPTGVVGAPLTLLRDKGDRAELVWKRDDLASVSLSTLTSSGTAWTVVRDPGAQTLSLVEVSTADGAPKRTLPLPESVGFATGVAVSPSGQIAVATHIGEVYFFDSKSNIEG